MSSLTFAVVIFSYNRGKMLSICLESLRICSPESKIFIVDDNSDDPETLSVLSTSGFDVTVLKPNSISFDWHGGLYSNMNMALRAVRDFDLVLFVQDDMQFVRRFGRGDFFEYAKLLSEVSGAAFLYPVFFKERTVENLRLELDSSCGFYISHNREILTGRFYSDIFIASPRALLEINWKFQQGELENARIAAESFAPMRYLINPIVAYVPRPRTYRGRERNIALKVIEWLFDFGRYRLEMMPDAADANFRTRIPSLLPVAEDYIKVVDRPLKSPWAYSAFELSPLVYPAYYFFENPFKYIFYQLDKRLARLRNFIRKR